MFSKSLISASVVGVLLNSEQKLQVTVVALENGWLECTQIRQVFRPFTLIR